MNKSPCNKIFVLIIFAVLAYLIYYAFTYFSFNEKFESDDPSLLLESSNKHEEMVNNTTQFPYNLLSNPPDLSANASEMSKIFDTTPVSKNQTTNVVGYDDKLDNYETASIVNTTGVIDENINKAVLNVVNSNGDVSKVVVPFVNGNAVMWVVDNNNKVINNDVSINKTNNVVSVTDTNGVTSKAIVPMENNKALLPMIDNNNKISNSVVTVENKTAIIPNIDLKQNISDKMTILWEQHALVPITSANGNNADMIVPVSQGVSSVPVLNNEGTIWVLSTNNLNNSTTTWNSQIANVVQNVTEHFSSKTIIPQFRHKLGYKINSNIIPTLVSKEYYDSDANTNQKISNPNLPLKLDNLGDLNAKTQPQITQPQKTQITQPQKPQPKKTQPQKTQIVIYYSRNCVHCKNYISKELPDLKKYIKKNLSKTTNLITVDVTTQNKYKYDSLDGSTADQTIFNNDINTVPTFMTISPNNSLKRVDMITANNIKWFLTN